LFSNPDHVANALYQTTQTTPNNFTEFLLQKSSEAILLTIEIIILVSLVIFIVTLIKGLKFLQKFDHHLSTIMAMITGLLIGITYGAGVLLKEAQYMSKKQVTSVCYFLMIAHAIIEDTLLFVFFGADIFLLIGIRLFFAILVFIAISVYYKPSDT
jgi:hypothetical protein